MASMDATTQARVRWFHLTPGRFVSALLAVEVLLWLSERFGWLGWHKGYAVLTCVAVAGVVLVVTVVWFAVALLLRWRFQFSIRSLLVLVVVVALPCNWFMVELRKAREQRGAIEWVEKLDGQVSYGRQPEAAGMLPACPVKLLGDEFFQTVVGIELRYKDFPGDACSTLKD